MSTTTVMATALPYSLADDARFHLTVFITHKLVDGGPGATLADFPAAADWIGTLGDATFGLVSSLDPGTALPLRVVSDPAPDAASWAAVLPPSTTVEDFPAPTPTDEAWRTTPASRMSDHAVDLHLAAIGAAPTRRPGVAGDPIAGGILTTLADLDPRGPLRRLLEDAPRRARRSLGLAARRLQDALATIGPLVESDELDPERGHGGEIEPPPPYQSEIADQPSPIQVLLDDPDADARTTRVLDALGRNRPQDPQLRMIADAHATRRYYERPEQPQQAPRREPDPDATPTPRPDRPEHDFHARVASFGSTPALLRRLGLAVDVVLDGMDAAAARAALAGATWVSVAMTSRARDVRVLRPRRTSVVVDGPVFAAQSSSAWVGGALPLGDDEWVVLDLDPDASGLKLDQHARDLPRRYASEANGDAATSAPGTLQSSGFAIARRERAADLRARVQRAEQLGADPSRDLLLDDLTRGIRVEVWDDVTRQWHSLHRRRVTVTGEGQPRVPVLTDQPDVGFLQSSALNRPPGGTGDYYVHEVVAGWDGWSLAAPRPGRVIVHVEPGDPDEPTEIVVDEPPDEPIAGAHTTSRVEPASLPRLRYGTSYSFRVLAVDLAGNSVPHVPERRRRRVLPDGPAVANARAHLDRLRESYRERDLGGIASARRTETIDHLRAPARESGELPPELRSGDARIDATLVDLIARAAEDDVPPADAQRKFDEVDSAARVLAEATDTPRIRPQLRIDDDLLALLNRNDDLLLPEELRRPARSVVTTPRPYLRWDPVLPPTFVARHELGTGEQLANLVVRSGAPQGIDARDTSERHVAPPKATQLEAETAGRFDAAIGTGDGAEIRRLFAIALAERGTFLDEFRPSLANANATLHQDGIALLDRPGADTGSDHRATLAEISADRGRPIGEGQYVVHDIDALALPYLPDPFATGVSLVFFEAGAPHRLSEPRALQTVTVPFPGTWPSLQPLRLVAERGDELDARAEGHEVHVTVPPGEQVRMAMSSTIDVGALEQFGLWRSHVASVADPDDGFTSDEVVAAAALMRAASSGWTWWLTPSTDVRIVHAVPEPVRPPELRGLSLFLRPEGRSVAALTGLVSVHGASTDLLVVRASWTDQVDDPTAASPGSEQKSDVVVHSPVGEGERTGVLFLFDLLATGPLAEALGGAGLHRMVQTFADTKYRRVTYVPSGTTRFAEYFDPSSIPDSPTEGEPVVLDIPSSARPGAPVVLDAVPLLRWEARSEPNEPFAWRQVRRSGVRLWLARPWYSSGDGELLGVLVFDPDEWVPTQNPNAPWTRQRKAEQAPTGATSTWAADPIVQHGGSTSNATVPPLLGVEHLLLDTLESAAAEGLKISPPLGGEVPGGRDRAWPDAAGNPVAVADAVPLRDVRDHPSVRVLGYRPEFDAASRRWFVDVALEEAPALWPFIRLAVARYQPNSIPNCELSPVELTDWVQPLPSRILTVSRTDAGRVQVTLTGVVDWLRWNPAATPRLGGDQLGADTPTGAGADRAARLQQSRTVRATLQFRAPEATDLEWEDAASALLLAVSVEESGGFRATWSGSVVVPETSVDRHGGVVPPPAMRRPGVERSSWRVLVEEHEILDADPAHPGDRARTVPRLVYVDAVSL
ncbi:hypothetical protein [Agromyces binzhouensis]|uniref:hypothetical protein n=1 Tax=Agromyces binzhouensis TaxID=1817495 RepID=UPI003636D4B5